MSENYKELECFKFDEMQKARDLVDEMSKILKESLNK